MKSFVEEMALGRKTTEVEQRHKDERVLSVFKDGRSVIYLVVISGGQSKRNKR